MQFDLARFRDAFFDEAVEHHQAFEAGLLLMESAPGDRDALDGVFRAAHSIKGSSAVFELPDVTRFTHVLENLLDQMRKGSLAITSERVSVLLRAGDVLRDLIASARAGGAPPEELEPTLATLRAAATNGGEPAPAVSAAPAAFEEQQPTRTLVIELEPGPQLLQRGMDPLLLLRELAGLGELGQVRANLDKLPPLAALDPERCYFAWRLELTTDAALDVVRDVFVFVEDDCRIAITERQASDEPAQTPVTSEAKPEPATPAERRELPERRSAELASIRVSIDKVDQLIDLVGELVIAQSMVQQELASTAGERSGTLASAVATLERNLRELQQSVMSVRMVPVSSVFGRFTRLVRDLGATLAKDIALEISGEETELDKGVVERIGDPLTHLVRNCADHGIETAAERRAAGKPERATIRLSARHEGGTIVIEVSDDGRGLDLERIKRKAIQNGLIAEGAQLGHAEALELIFRPGFSTAERVNDLSGRGVGMDVVKRNVEALNGTIAIESARGQGTKFRIKLPLTLAILDGLIVSAGERVYVLPLLSIVESIHVRADAVRSLSGQGEIALVRGEALPLLSLSQLLGHASARAESSHCLAVIIEQDGQRIGLRVDGLIGQAQVVIKNLEANYQRIDGVTGATILGDGTVALILDAVGLIRLARRGVRGASNPELALSR